MTYTKERIKTDLNQAKAESKQRANRIAEILKGAASSTFEEVKGGSVEINELTRKSVSELLEELKENPDIVVDAETVDIQVKADYVPEMPAPTWRELVGRAIGIVRHRKGDWFQQLKDLANERTTQVDGKLNEQYGDRYAKAKSILQQIVALVETARAKSAQTATAEDVKPVNIEVKDDTDTDSGINPA
jgi:hypothetical protein